MSIMDHDPKYAKLRAWREERRRKQLEDWLRTLRFPTHNAVPRKQYPELMEAFKWRPIISYVREREQ